VAGQLLCVVRASERANECSSLAKMFAGVCSLAWGDKMRAELRAVGSGSN